MVGMGAYVVATFGAALVLVILELDRIPVLRKIRTQAEVAGPTERSQEADPPPD
jgi:hypothetical protein